MTIPTKLQYKTLISTGSSTFHVLESYDSVLERMADSAFKASGDEELASITMLQFIELTARHQDGRPMKMAVNPTHIAQIIQLFPEDYVEVVE